MKNFLPAGIGLFLLIFLGGGRHRNNNIFW